MTGCAGCGRLPGGSACCRWRRRRLSALSSRTSPRCCRTCRWVARPRPADRPRGPRRVRLPRRGSRRPRAAAWRPAAARERAAVMPGAAVATATSPLWFATRATGLIALVLLTGTVVLGMVTSVRFASPAWPRFITVSLHRNLSLLTITFTGLHVLTTITDPFASISAVSAVVPFTSDYRRIWLGLGAVAFDLLLAVLVTSLLRTRIGPRAWRAVHWASYACWPVALVHGLGTGTDGAARWVLAVTAACALAVVSAGVWRLAAGWPAHAGLRVAAAAAAAVVALATAGWAWAGPLSPGWARRSGTPAGLLARSSGNGATASAGSAGESAGEAERAAFVRDRPFSP